MSAVGGGDWPVVAVGTGVAPGVVVAEVVGSPVAVPVVVVLLLVAVAADLEATRGELPAPCTTTNAPMNPVTTSATASTIRLRRSDVIRVRGEGAGNGVGYGGGVSEGGEGGCIAMSSVQNSANYSSCSLPSV